MSQDNNNRNIRAVHWPDTESEQGRSLRSPECGDLVFVSEYRGDHSLDWIVQCVNGKEVARHNARYVETIVWLEDDEDAT